MNKFNIGDKVGTKIEYMHGFNERVFGPRGLQRLINLEIIDVIFVGKTDMDSEFTEPYIYECKSKTRTYLLNQCFLECNYS